MDNHWFAIIILAAYGATITVMGLRHTDSVLMRLVMAFNTLGNQPLALIVLCIGCLMVIACKIYSIDTTIAGGVIGCAVNMLTNPHRTAHIEIETQRPQI